MIVTPVKERAARRSQRTAHRRSPRLASPALRWDAKALMLDRKRIGRQSSPTGAIIDSQSVKTTESGRPTSTKLNSPRVLS
jgi:hypothetical protein